jgi:sortase A
MNTEIILYDYKKHTKKALRLRTMFRALTFLGLFGLILLVSPMLLTEAKFRLYQGDEEQTVIINPVQKSTTPLSKQGFGNLISKRYMQEITPVDPSFSLIIPKIGVNSKIISNVNVADRNAYDAALKQGIAHAAGSSLPGHNGNTYLFAHSTDFVWNILNFNAVFYLLKDVSTGDTMYIVYNGDVFPYRVREKKIVESTETNYLRPDYSSEQLTLQTCYPPGTTWKRLLVFADPTSEWEGMKELITYNK